MNDIARTLTYADYIFHHALTRPDKPAVMFAGNIVTYRMLAYAIQFVERRVGELALAPGALVTVTVASPLKQVIIGAALFRLGYASLSLQTAADLAQLDLPVAALLEDPGSVSSAATPQAFVTDDWFAGVPQKITPRAASAYPGAHAICRIALASDAAGLPKAVAVSVGAFNSRLWNYYSVAGQGRWRRMLCLPAPFSSWGFELASHALMAGKTLCFVDSARAALEAISTYEIDFLAASSRHLRELVGEQARSPALGRSLRMLAVGGSPLPQALADAARAHLCNTVVNQYGSTEAGISAFSAVDRMIGIDGAVGFVAPWAAIEAVDDEDRPLPPNSDGVLRIRADWMGQDYPAGKPGAESALRDGWFYPGDRGRIRENGLVIVSGTDTSPAGRMLA